MIKGGRGRPNTTADPPFIFDYLFLTSLLLKFCSSSSKFSLELWPLNMWNLPLGSKDTVLKKFGGFAPSESPTLLFQYLILTIIDNICKIVSKILLWRRVCKIIAGISYIIFLLKDSKKIRHPNFLFDLRFWSSTPYPQHFHDISHTTFANFWRPHFLL